MTREEAIAYFKRHIELYCVEGISRESEKMAIKALEQEPCEDCISREQAIKATYGFERYTGIDEAPYEYAESILRDLPPVTPQQKTGHWIGQKQIGFREWEDCIVPLKDGFVTGSCSCSECGEWLTASDEYLCYGNYCPKCGAKMAEGDVLDKQPTVDAIIIPKGATREQVFEVVFGIGMMMAGLKNMDWWNAPYKAESEE